eukprot:TRINITY_DN22131_c0_g1_i1.p1 TRINITY_DN22131_c0_g1~~TRINITY_DN22131_c0_g1_i1.p1  ORF type:complete len:106 (+),score=37.99 TRINITY_DN22131_c0_g1_i1:39-356(+)
MAKSLRSKWKRKMKAVKRVRYGEKEKAVLNKILDAAKEAGTLKTGQDLKEDAMDTTAKSDHSHTSLKNQHGNYPKWVSKRKIAQIKKVKQKKKTTKKQNQRKSKV